MKYTELCKLSEVSRGRNLLVTLNVRTSGRNLARWILGGCQPHPIICFQLKITVTNCSGILRVMKMNYNFLLLVSNGDN